MHDSDFRYSGLRKLLIGYSNYNPSPFPNLKGATFSEVLGILKTRADFSLILLHKEQSLDGTTDLYIDTIFRRFDYTGIGAHGYTKLKSGEHLDLNQIVDVISVPSNKREEQEEKNFLFTFYHLLKPQNEQTINDQIRIIDTDPVSAYLTFDGNLTYPLRLAKIEKIGPGRQLDYPEILREKNDI